MNIISLVSYPFLPARSGGQKGIALFYKYFSRHHQVTIITTKKNQGSLADGYELLNILPDSPTRYINPLIFFSVRKRIREKKATHLILEHPYYGWLGILLKKFCGIRLVIHSHNIEGRRWKSLGKWWWRILWNYEKITHRFADYNFFIQEEDRQFAIREFRLDEKKSLTVSFGTELSEPFSQEKKMSAHNIICQQLQIPGNTPLLLFNGAFGYAPNRDALDNLLFNVNPILQSRGLHYQVLVVGLDIPETILKTSYPGIRVLGFVENLELYLEGCQVFLNTVQTGGGIKTKLVEALAYGLNAVSTENGAIGVDPGLCNGKLVLSPDNDWNTFSDAVARVISLNSPMPIEFYRHFFWGNITLRAARFIEG
jgi:polysaccharide biosynthesis protein PslH